MKTYILILLMALTFAACKKGDQAPYQSQGAIIGDDIRLCALESGHCGGLEITIKDDPTKNPPPFYYIETDLAQLGISAGSKFPVNVILDWKHDPTDANYIIVTNVRVD